MLRSPLLACVLLGALTACNREPASQKPPVKSPIVVATVPALDGSAAPAPSVPADIVKTPPRRPPVDPRRTDPPEDQGNEEYADRDGGSPGDEAFDPDAGEGNNGDDGSGYDDAPPRPMSVHWNGIGEIEFGMGVDDVRDAWPGDLGDYGTAEEEACLYLSQTPRRPADAPALMFEQGRLVRFDIDTSATSAPGGGRVGMDTLEILERYGEDNIERMPHKYSDGEYLRIGSPDGDSVLLFETGEEGVVTEWRIGVEPQVDYVEGCS